MLSTVIAKLKGVAPYAAMALVLPGGLLLAPLLWVYHRLVASAEAKQS